MDKCMDYIESFTPNFLTCCSFRDEMSMLPVHEYRNAGSQLQHIDDRVICNDLIKKDEPMKDERNALLRAHFDVSSYDKVATYPFLT